MHIRHDVAIDYNRLCLAAYDICMVHTAPSYPIYIDTVA